MDFLGAVMIPDGGGFLGIGGALNGLLRGMYNLVGDYGLAIILFTVLLRVIMLPLDFGTKYFTKKNALKMAEMKPELDKVNKLYAGKMLERQRATQAVFRKNGHRQGGFMMFMMLNVTVMLIVFITVFGNLREISNLNLYNQAVELQTIHETYYGVVTDEELSAKLNEAFNNSNVSFLWVSNMWQPDNWAGRTHDWNGFRGAVGELGREVPLTQAQYEAIFTHINPNHQGWNGLLILVILAGVTMYFSAVINTRTMQKKADEKKQKEEEEPQARYSMRETWEQSGNGSPAMPQLNPAMMGNIMKIMLPLLMVFITLISTAALALYITVGAIVQTGFTFLTTFVADKILKKQGVGEKKEEERVINPHAKYFKKGK